jgi:hypothetical protein
MIQSPLRAQIRIAFPSGESSPFSIFMCRMSIYIAAGWSGTEKVTTLCETGNARVVCAAANEEMSTTGGSNQLRNEQRSLQSIS